MLEIAHTAVSRDLNGPGRRFTVWVQGCARSCPGCFNPGLQPFGAGRRAAPSGLAAEALGCGLLNGISLSGGEPFAQAAGLAAFLDAVRARAGGERLTALAFTGYTLEELRQAGPAERALLEQLDLLIDGPFVEALASPLPLRGSANQRLIALTAAGEVLKAAAERLPGGTFGVEITASAEVLVTGFPPQEALRALQRGG